MLSGTHLFFWQAALADSADNGGLQPATPMDLQEFTLTTANDHPPTGLKPALEALWYVRKGDWHRAHSIVQANEEVAAYARIHAHLHRIEGDPANAAYWYRRSGNKTPEMALEDEWKMLVTNFLKEND